MKPASRLLRAIPLLFLVGCATREADDQFNNYWEAKTSEMKPGPLKACVRADFDEPPILVSGSKPIYPVGELLKSKIAAVAFAFTITETGSVIPSEKNMNEKTWFLNHVAMASRDWVFLPARKDGKTVSARCRIIFAYNLD